MLLCTCINTLSRSDKSEVRTFSWFCKHFQATGKKQWVQSRGAQLNFWRWKNTEQMLNPKRSWCDSRSAFHQEAFCQHKAAWWRAVRCHAQATTSRCQRAAPEWIRKSRRPENANKAWLDQQMHRPARSKLHSLPRKRECLWSVTQSTKSVCIPQHPVVGATPFSPSMRAPPCDSLPNVSFSVGPRVFLCAAHSHSRHESTSRHQEQVAVPYGRTVLRVWCPPPPQSQAASQAVQAIVLCSSVSWTDSSQEVRSLFVWSFSSRPHVSAPVSSVRLNPTPSVKPPSPWAGGTPMRKQSAVIGRLSCPLHRLRASHNNLRFGVKQAGFVGWIKRHFLNRQWFQDSPSLVCRCPNLAARELPSEGLLCYHNNNSRMDKLALYWSNLTTLLRDLKFSVPKFQPRNQPIWKKKSDDVNPREVHGHWSTLYHCFRWLLFVTLNLFLELIPLFYSTTGVVDYLTTEISTSKQKKFSLVTFVDTPGLVDGDMKYPFDVNKAILWLGKWRLKLDLQRGAPIGDSLSFSQVTIAL